jgi:cell wall-associated NlpC family hydrolase
MKPITARICAAGAITASATGLASNAGADATPSRPIRAALEFPAGFAFPRLATRPFELPRAVARRAVERRAAAAAAAAAAADHATVAVRKIVAAGDRIAHLPYVWGGGHGSFTAPGYDCSGSVSYVLHGAGLLATPLDSTGFESYGLPGPGRHVTVYANAEHAWMTIDGRRYDTIAYQETGSRWSSAAASDAGYVARHPAGM